MKENILLKIEGLSKSFGTKKVLDNISLEVNKGEILGIIGISGEGKTTLLNLLTGGMNPDSGKISYFEREKNLDFENNNLELKNFFGIAFQDPSFYLNLTPEENLEYFSCLYGLPKSTRKRNTPHLLKLVGLYQSRKTVSSVLSGGMKKRLDIACSIVHNPKILYLDEPTSDLDPILRAHVWDLINEINSHGTTIVVCSHFIEELAANCDRIAILHKKHICKVDKPHMLAKSGKQKEEIHVQSSPGDYKKIIEKLDEKNIISKINKGYELTLITLNPEKTLEELFFVLKKLGETVLNININKYSIAKTFDELVREK